MFGLDLLKVVHISLLMWETGRAGTEKRCYLLFAAAVRIVSVSLPSLFDNDVPSKEPFSNLCKSKLQQFLAI